eukprot:TRINITY_DN13575_c0_g1_i1.p1 TRINITY_DN13575_c0_g1~~TRINITY_DN13575_c0_g1_i1.p1  ORF type:complete len:624 (+),score=180.42 TRINITY_DN13575_c0_g1_i1:132-2003(+)
MDWGGGGDAWGGGMGGQGMGGGYGVDSWSGDAWGAAAAGDPASKRLKLEVPRVDASGAPGWGSSSPSKPAAATNGSSGGSGVIAHLGGDKGVVKLQLTGVAARAHKAPNELTFGFVSKVYPSKGYSFVSIDPADETATVFVHGSVCDPKNLRLGQPVGFKLHVSKDGKWQASHPLWSLQGDLKGDEEMHWGAYEGTITDISEAGTCVVTCPELKKEGGQDGWINDRIVDNCDLWVGDMIRFDVMGKAPNGQPNVVAPLWRAKPRQQENEFFTPEMMNYMMMMKGKGKGDAMAMMGMDAWMMGKGGDDGKGKAWMMMMMKGKGKGMDKGKPPADKGAGKGSGMEDLSHGTVNSVDRWGGSFKIRTEDDLDIFADHTACDPQEVKVGDYVACGVDASSGTAVATAGVWKLYGVREPVPDLKFAENHGRIKRIQPAGSAFVECGNVQARYGRECYIHSTLITEAGLKEGDAVAFKVHVSPAGLPQLSAPFWRKMLPTKDGASGAASTGQAAAAATGGCGGGGGNAADGWGNGGAAASDDWSGGSDAWTGKAAGTATDAWNGAAGAAGADAWTGQGADAWSGADAAGADAWAAGAGGCWGGDGGAGADAWQSQQGQDGGAAQWGAGW